MKVMMKWWTSNNKVPNIRKRLERFANAGNNFLLFTAMMGNGTVATRNTTAKTLNIKPLLTIPKKRWA